MARKRGRRSARQDLDKMQAEIQRYIEEQRANPDYDLGKSLTVELEPPATRECLYPGQVQCRSCGHFYSKHLHECPYRGCHAPNRGDHPIVTGAFAAWA